MIIRIVAVVFAVAAGLSLCGCLFSESALFTSSEEMTVPDFSGMYVPLEKSGKMVVDKKAGNVFAVRYGENADPDRVLVVPLDARGMYLLQYESEGDYAFLVIRHSDDRVDVFTFAALLEEDRDVTKRLEAMLQKHDLNINNSLRLLETPSTAKLIGFFTECAGDPHMLTEFESWIRVPAAAGAAGEE